MNNISVLFVEKKSIYKKMQLDCWDINRDARNFKGSNIVICHPPCRGWGKLRHFANDTQEERDLALFAIEKIRQNGGILEHPRHSLLFKNFLPLPGFVDSYNGFSILINQNWFGHRAQKETLLYFCGITPKELPKYPITFNAITHVISSSKNYANKKNGLLKKEVNKSERNATPKNLAEWLVKVANVIAKNNNLTI